MARRMTIIILRRVNKKLPVIVDIFNYHVSFTSFLTTFHYRENLKCTVQRCSMCEHESSESNSWPHHKQGEELSQCYWEHIFFFSSSYVSCQTKNPKNIPNINISFKFVVVPVIPLTTQPDPELLLKEISDTYSVDEYKTKGKFLKVTRGTVRCPHK